MDSNPKNVSRLPVVIVALALAAAAAAVAVLYRENHRLKFQLSLAVAEGAQLKSDGARLQAGLDQANANATRLQAQVQQLARLYAQASRNNGHRMPVFAGFARVPVKPGQPPAQSFQLRIRSLVPGQLHVSIKTTIGGRETTTPYTISRIWTAPDVFGPGDKAEIAVDGYSPLRLIVPNFPRPPPQKTVPPPPQAAKAN